MDSHLNTSKVSIWVKENMSRFPDKIDESRG